MLSGTTCTDGSFAGAGARRNTKLLCDCNEMLCDYIGIKPDLYKRYMDSVGGAASCTKDDLTSDTAAK